MKKVLVILISFLFISNVCASQEYFKFEANGAKSGNISDTVEVTFKTDKKLYFYSGKLEFDCNRFELISYEIDDSFNDVSEIDKKDNKYYIKAKHKDNGADYFKIKVKVKILKTKREYDEIALRMNSGVAKYEDFDGIYDIPGQNFGYNIYINDVYNANKKKNIYGSLVFGLAIFICAFYIVFIKKIK